MNANRLIEALGENGTLESLAANVQPAVKRFLDAAPQLKDALRGKWLGHALHPVLTDVTIGNYTAAFLLDITGRSEMESAADYLLALGILSTVGTAATGAADWSTVKGRARQVGVVHALTNVTALALYVSSLVLRRTGKRKAGITLSYVAGGIASLAGYLGGHLVFEDGIGVNQETMHANQPRTQERVSASDLSYH